MQVFRSARWLLLALVVTLIPVSSQAGVFISVGVAPPMLPVYEQPPCPEPGLMWTPGYWAYGPDGYYWVPGAWVPAPYEGALWTPGYWGWNNGMYVFHDGYWGRHIGYYGGVNYGGGYFGIGFAGGMWRGHSFIYNTAVLRVNDRFIHNTYEDRGIIGRYTIANDRHVAFSGGPGGIRHDAGPDERLAERERHVGATSFQHTHESTAMGDHGSYFHNNGGRPATMAVERPYGYNAGSNAHVQGGIQAGPAQRQQFQQQAQPQRQQFQQQVQPQRQQFQQPQQQTQRYAAPQAQPQQHAAPQAQPQHAAPQAQAQHAAPQAQSHAQPQHSNDHH